MGTSALCNSHQLPFICITRGLRECLEKECAASFLSPEPSAISKLFSARKYSHCPGVRACSPYWMRPSKLCGQRWAWVALSKTDKGETWFTQRCPLEPPVSMPNISSRLHSLCNRWPGMGGSSRSACSGQTRKRCWQTHSCPLQMVHPNRDRPDPGSRWVYLSMLQKLPPSLELSPNPFLLIHFGPWRAVEMFVTRWINEQEYPAMLRKLRISAALGDRGHSLIALVFFESTWKLVPSPKWHRWLHTPLCERALKDLNLQPMFS